MMVNDSYYYYPILPCFTFSYNFVCEPVKKIDQDLPVTHTDASLFENYLLRLELALVFPEEEGMMQQSSVSISLSF